MTDFEILDQMIKDTSKVSAMIKYGKAFAILNEPQSPGSSVTIYGIPSGALIIKVDTFQSPDTIFCGSKGECKRADYVIVSDSGNKKRILYIEMKKTKDSRNSVIKQLAGAKCFMSYCQEIGKMFWNKRDFLEEYHHRFVSIGHISIAKRKTRVDRQTGKHDTPEKAMKIDWPKRLQLNHLLGT